MQPVLDWAEDNLSPGSSPDTSPEVQTLLQDLHPSLTLDMTSLYLAAHSSGSHVAVEFLKMGGHCSDVKVSILYQLYQHTSPGHGAPLSRGRYGPLWSVSYLLY